MLPRAIFRDHSPEALARSDKNRSPRRSLASDSSSCDAAAGDYQPSGLVRGSRSGTTSRAVLLLPRWVRSSIKISELPPRWSDSRDSCSEASGLLRSDAKNELAGALRAFSVARSGRSMPRDEEPVSARTPCAAAMHVIATTPASAEACTRSLRLLIRVEIVMMWTRLDVNICLVLLTRPIPCKSSSRFSATAG
jgi:hypothetical protein